MGPVASHLRTIGGIEHVKFDDNIINKVFESTLLIPFIFYL